MKATWIIALFAFACVSVSCSQEQQASKSKPSAEPSAKAPKSATPATKPATPDKPKVEAAPSAPPPDIDCAALITADEVKKACKAKVTWSADKNEVAGGPNHCSRKAGSGGARMQYTVGVYPDEKAAGTASKDVAPGSFTLEEGGGGGMKSAKVYGRKGVLTVTVSTQTMGSAKPLCAADKLEGLAKAAYQRLP